MCSQGVSGGVVGWGTSMGQRRKGMGKDLWSLLEMGQGRRVEGGCSRSPTGDLGVKLGRWIFRNCGRGEVLQLSYLLPWQ